MCFTEILHWRRKAVIDRLIDLSFLDALFQKEVLASMIVDAIHSMYQCSSGTAVGPGRGQHTSMNAGGEESLYLLSQVVVAYAKELNRTALHCSLSFTHIYSISIGLHFCRITLYANVLTVLCNANCSQSILCTAKGAYNNNYLHWSVILLIIIHQVV